MVIIEDCFSKFCLFLFAKAKTALQGPKAFILSSTRQLAIQIHQEVQKYNYCDIHRLVYL